MTYRIQKQPPASECYLRCEYTMWASTSLAPLMMVGVPAVLAIAWFWATYHRFPAETKKIIEFIWPLVLVALPLAYRVLSHKPVFAFYAEGLWLGGVGLVPWPEIAKAEELDERKGYRDGPTCIVTFRPPLAPFWAEPLTWATLTFCCGGGPDGCLYNANAIDYSRRQNHLHGDERKDASRLASLINNCAAAKDGARLGDILHQASKGHF